MTALGESVAKSTNRAFATPWEVCYNVAYPPSECGVCEVSSAKKDNGRGMRSRCPSVIDF